MAMSSAAIVSVLASLAWRKAQIAPERTAHVLASAARGFKQTADTPDELRALIKELLALSLGT
jgi:hypothetical protein